MSLELNIIFKPSTPLRSWQVLKIEEKEQLWFERGKPVLISYKILITSWISQDVACTNASQNGLLPPFQIEPESSLLSYTQKKDKFLPMNCAVRIKFLKYSFRHTFKWHFQIICHIMRNKKDTKQDICSIISLT